MSHVMRRRHVLQAALCAGVGVFAPAAQAHEYFTAHFTVEHPWTHASARGAGVAAIGMSFLDVTVADRLIAAHSPLATGAELVGADNSAPPGIAIPAGQITTLTAAGAHLRLVGLTQPLKLGREYPVTLVFERAGALKASFLVDYPAPE